MRSRSIFRINDTCPVRFNDALPASVDVVVIGAGVIGMCTARYLSKRGLKTLVCDKGRVAGEQSSRNWGWVRTTARDPDEVPIALDSADAWAELQESLGDGIGFRRHGIVSLVRTEEELAAFDAWMKVAAHYGVDSRLIGADKARELSGAPDGRWLGGIATPADGHAEPFTAVLTLAKAFQENGGLVREACAVRGVETEAGCISAVVTERGRVRAGAVVCAAGAWSAMFLSNMGVRLPMLTVRNTVARTSRAPAFFAGSGKFDDICIRRRQDGGYTVGCDFAEHFIGADSFRNLASFMPSLGGGGNIAVRLGRDVTQQSFPRKKWNHEDVAPFERHRVLNTVASQNALRKMRERLAKHIPQLADLAFEESWAGMIDVAPDVVPVMDAIPDCPGVFLATGFSGHGFGIGPGAGKVMADLVTGRDTGYDLTRFRFSRFSDGSKMRPGPTL